MSEEYFDNRQLSAKNPIEVSENQPLTPIRITIEYEISKNIRKKVEEENRADLPR